MSPADPNPQPTASKMHVTGHSCPQSCSRKKKRITWVCYGVPTSNPARILLFTEVASLPVRLLRNLQRIAKQQSSNSSQRIIASAIRRNRHQLSCAPARQNYTFRHKICPRRAHGLIPQ
jgi:hypothetical protein